MLRRYLKTAQKWK